LWEKLCYISSSVKKVKNIIKTSDISCLSTLVIATASDSKGCSAAVSIQPICSTGSSHVCFCRESLVNAMRLEN